MACPNHHLLEGAAAPIAPDYDRIARRIGTKLREMYSAPEGDPLPAEHVDLLLRLRQKERERMRSGLG